MDILICNERLLFRFGVDRFLLILAQGLKSAGHRISFMAHRADRSVLAPISDRFVEVPAHEPYADFDAATASWLGNSWAEIFENQPLPDVAILGGWPFFGAISVFRERGVKIIFPDCGAVPTDGMSGPALNIQKVVRGRRTQFLPRADLITPISQFIAATQSRADAPDVRIEPILLGADHLDMTLWKSGSVPAAVSTTVQKTLSQLQSNGRDIVFVLGRWEPETYKQSELTFDVCRQISKRAPKSAFVVLGSIGEVVVPDDLRGGIFPVGHPDDDDLVALMRAARAGISLSSWEGFNLPLAEMQWLGRPVFCFRAGAHPEVVADEWFLCESPKQMGDKLQSVLSKGVPSAVRKRGWPERIHDRLRWSDTIGRYLVALKELVPPVVIDVSNAAKDGANSGVIRVTRRLAQALQGHCDPIFVIWDETRATYVLPTQREYEVLSSFNGPSFSSRSPLSDPGDRLDLAKFLRESKRQPMCLLLTETVNEANATRARSLVQTLGLEVAAIFYDAIPVLYPDLVTDTATRHNHASYMQGLAQCALVLSISQYSEDCLKRFWSDQGIVPRAQLSAVLLPGQFGDEPRSSERTAGVAINMLCVSTLEPRKNHRAVIAAFEQFQKASGLEATLDLVGNRYAGGEDIAAFVEAAVARNPRIRWHGVVDDATLARLYRACTFTVYASTVEGFGLPILESLWFGKPVILHSDGVMAEHAARGGCVAIDVNSEGQLANAMARLATDRPLATRLIREAREHPISDWRDYGARIWRELRGLQRASNAILQAPSWRELAYPPDSAGATMGDAEVLALGALLERLEPACTIAVGPHSGASLASVAARSKVVFAVGIDETATRVPGDLHNVSFVPGPAHDVMPLLLEELEREAIGVDLIFVAADQGCLRETIARVLGRAPAKAMFFLMHGAASPQLRSEMLSTEWQRSPYVHHVDLDFVPGRISGVGAMGGMALVVLQTEKRSQPLVVADSTRCGTTS